MDDCRNKIIVLSNYLREILGIQVNIGKNKARGNKGFFASKNCKYRIDISNNIDDNSILSTLVHEFAHYIHFKNDNTLQHLDFIFDSLSEIEQEELLKITVEKVPKNFASSLYNIKNKLVDENKHYVSVLKDECNDFQVSKPNKLIERSFTTPYSFLLKYDRIKLLGNCYSIDELNSYNLSNVQISYLKLKSNLRHISRLNSKISRLNKYYTQPSELWARFFETYCLNKDIIQSLAPNLFKNFTSIINSKNIPELSTVYEIVNPKS